VLLYWLFLIIVYGVKLRSFIAQEMFKTNVPYFAVFTANVGLATLELLLEYLVPKRVSDYDALGDEDECPIEYADLFSILTFSWMTPMMKYGYKEFLTQDDLWNLRKRDTTRSTAGIFEEAWENEVSYKKKPMYLTVLFWEEMSMMKPMRLRFVSLCRGEVGAVELTQQG
jgi:ATP-binding cassette, subfamily C (CFTR/MRP), member 1